MVDSRKLTKQKNYSIIGLLLLLYTMALPFVAESSALETESTETSCSDLRTCSKCTTKARCSWSLTRQACVKKSRLNRSNLTVSDAATCPRFSVFQKYENGDNRTVLQYTLEVSVDSADLMRYVRGSNITCGTKLQHFGAAKREWGRDGTALYYTFTRQYMDDYFTGSDAPSAVFFYAFFRFNDVKLPLDNEADHYLALYRRECADDERDRHCATCGWVDGHRYSNYLKWCSADNACDGRSQLHLKFYADGEDLNGENLNGRLYPLDDVVQLDGDHCAAMNVTAVRPLSGPRAGGTAVTIDVTNHWTLAENGAVTVTVAGTLCADPRTSGRATITCTTAAAAATTGAASGPVLVRYTSPEGRGAIVIRSAHTFQFVAEEPACGAPGPVIHAHRHQLGGIASGGTAVPVVGGHFVEPCVVSRARLYVVLADGQWRYADGYCDRPVNDTYMVCRTPRAAPVGRSLQFGLHVAGFAGGNRSLTVDGPSAGFAVHPDPELVDFEVDGSNGTVLINGRHLQYVRPDEIVVRFRHDSANASCVVVSATRHVAVCKPTAAVDVPRQISVKIGTSLEYTVTIKGALPVPADDPPAPTSTLPGWTMVAAASLSLVLFVSASLWCRRAKRWHDCLDAVGDDLPLQHSDASQHLEMNTEL